jgi:cell division protein FtsB
VTGQDRTPEEELEHWRSELARVLKAAPDLTWSNLIDWAEEAEHFALKACTKSGRARLAGLDTRVTELEAEVARLTQELEEARRAKLNDAQPRLAAMEKLAAAWQKEAERARKDLADQAYWDDTVEFIIWSALDRPLDEVDVRAVIKTIRNCRYLAAETLNVCADTWKDAEKRLRDLHTPVQHMGQTWCAECSVRRSTGPRSDEWVAYLPHPCPTLDALANKEPT